MQKSFVIWLFLSVFVLDAWAQNSTDQKNDFAESVLLNTKDTTSKTITGKVTDLTGLPLAGAVVILMGTNIEVVTSADGSFTLIAKTGDVLDISLVGYISRQIRIGSDYNIIASLSPIIVNLDEVLVTG